MELRRHGVIGTSLTIKLTATEKNAILNAFSWYADDAEKVIASIQRYSKAEPEAAAARLGCGIDELGDFGLYAQPDGSYVTYESSIDLRDSEAVPLKDSRCTVEPVDRRPGGSCREFCLSPRNRSRK